jgi:hypothetical protein
MTSRREQPIFGGMLTSVTDLLFLMVIALLTIGALVSAMQPAEPELPLPADRPEEGAPEVPAFDELLAQKDRLVRNRDNLAARTPSDWDRRQRAEAVAAERQELESTQSKKAELEQSERELRQKVEENEKEVESYSEQKEELEDILEVAGDRGRTTAELRKRMEELEQKWRSILNPPPDPAGEAATIGDVVWVNDAARIAERFGVLLHDGKVLPIISDYFTGMPTNTGQTIWPIREGLSTHDAMRVNSALMREVTRPGFKDTCMVVMLVNPDSFAAFRALRKHLATRGIRVGWEPLEGNRIQLADKGGRTIKPQGGNN